ncbi:MAG: hypothetical protein V3V10_10885, partial [Planctomycetota bacterium]
MANDTSKVKFRKRWPIKWGLRLFGVLRLLVLLPVGAYFIAPEFCVDPHRLELKIKTDRGAQFPCPDCGKLCKVHDFTDRTWRHLN